MSRTPHPTSSTSSHRRDEDRHAKREWEGERRRATRSCSPHEKEVECSLRGSTRMWFERYLSQGYNPADARHKALLQKSKAESILRRNASYASMPTTSRFARGTSREQSEGTRQITSTASISHKIGILPEGYPNVILDYEELTSLEQAIMKEVAKGAAQKIMFDGLYQRPGMMMIICSNTFSMDWLLQVVPQLSEWRGKKLVALKKSEIPVSHTASMFLPRCQDMDTKTILRLIEVQNENLKVRRWIVTALRPEGRGLRLTVFIDEASKLAIAQQEYTLRFGFGFVQVNGLRSRTPRRSSMLIDTTQN